MQYYKEHRKEETNEIVYDANDDTIINNRAIHGDIINILDNEVINIKKRNIKNIVGILYLDSKIKYGSIKDKSLYLFKPTNKLYPHFYVPYKNDNKNYKVYAIINFKIWNIENKLPIGTLIEIIGNIDNEMNEIEHLRNYYEIRNDSFKKMENHLLCDNQLKNEKVEYEVFSIDPLGSKDIDDAFHFNENNRIYEIGIHIAEPYKYFENDLLEIMNRVSTVYTKYRKYNMLPNNYADNICSLIENEKRYSLSIIITIRNNIFESYIIKECVVMNIKNYDYDTFDKIYLKNKNLRKMMDVTRDFFNLKDINSHILVENWMIYTNKIIAKHLINMNISNTIVRVHNNIYNYEDDTNDIELKYYLQLKKESSAIYQIYNKENIDQTHSKLGNEFYTHFTSPIRRAVDLFIHALIIKEGDILDNILLEKILEKINIFTKNNRKFENAIRRINFLYSWKELSENIITYGYIVKIKENSLMIYMPQYKLEEKIIICPKKFDKIMNKKIKKDNNDVIMEIEYNDTTYDNIMDNIKIYRLYQKIKVKLWIFTSFENIFDKIKVELM